MVTGSPSANARIVKSFWWGAQSNSNSLGARDPNMTYSAMLSEFTQTRQRRLRATVFQERFANPCSKLIYRSKWVRTLLLA